MLGIRLLRTAPKKDLSGVCFLRLDFNTEDEWRMEAALPTIRFLLRHAGKVVIGSHRGRPAAARALASKSGDFDPRFSLRKDAKALGKFLGKPVRFIPLEAGHRGGSARQSQKLLTGFIPDFRFDEIRREVLNSPKGSVLLLENLRFAAGEEANDAGFAKRLASLADFYVNDAFAVCHRDEASVDAITRFLPSYAGLELEKEIAALSNVLRRPKRPLVVILGGGKAHDKLGVLRWFKKKAASFLLGGAAANTFLSLRGEDVGRSLVDENPADIRRLREVLGWTNLILPRDWRISQGRILDIGEKTIRIYEKKIAAARTIVWSGPMGYIEKKPFDAGTLALARAAAKNRKAFSIAGGGETVMFLKKHKLDVKFGFVSTGGGAMLDFLAGEKLPGIEALKRHA